MDASSGWDGNERRHQPLDISEFPDDWREKINFAYDALAGRRKNAFLPRTEGVLDRLDRLERLIKYGVGISGILGSVAGSLVTVAIQHLVK
ncbi:MAG: hypothetical protein ACREML_01880 [Vulcanimicrobiaceae bacterium]